MKSESNKEHPNTASDEFEADSEADKEAQSRILRLCIGQIAGRAGDTTFQDIEEWLIRVHEHYFGRVDTYDADSGAELAPEPKVRHLFKSTLPEDNED